jgi:4-amino-4-deoxy-L-arabinose transferase-like glycosyltransferase
MSKRTYFSAWLPEAILLAAFSFFALRLLGSFPRAWADDGLFMIVAKMVAQGRGYVLPVLGWDWPQPYILAVGPTLILPVALAIKLGGMSIAIARIPMVLYLFATLCVTYAYTRGVFGPTSARWIMALFISFSAFINTGKPVLGEIPGFFFLMLGFLLLRSMGQRKYAIGTGIAFGLAVVTKLPYALLLPALGIAWIVNIGERRHGEARQLIVVGITALCVILAGAYWLGALESGYFHEIELFALGQTGSNDTRLFEPIFNRPTEFLRIAYAHYVLVVILATIGWWESRASFRRTEHLLLALLPLLFAIYFLHGPGWYRHLLPSTLFLFLFLPKGAQVVLGKRMGLLLLAGIILTQGVWQYQMHGASPDPQGQTAAETIQQSWTNAKMIIVEPEIFVRLPDNPNWLFLTDEMREATRRPPEVEKRFEETRCLPVLRRLSREDAANPPTGAKLVSGRYFLLPPAGDCPEPA